MSYDIFGTHIDPTSYPAVVDQVIAWAKRGESRRVFVAAVKTVMDAYDSPEYRRIINEADVVTPDGMPLVWMLRLRGERDQERVYGPRLTREVVRAAAREGIPIGLIGGRPEVLDRLAERLTDENPGLKIVFRCSPPFRSLSNEEDTDITRAANTSGVRILFVGLGGPKQEYWIADHADRVPAVMLGVGAAFDLIAGVRRSAPTWMQAAGLEWLVRLVQEPGRLWRRYLLANPRFLFLMLREWISKKE